MRSITVIKWIGAFTLLNCGLLLGLTQCSSLEPSENGVSTSAASTSNRYGSYLAGRFAASERDSSAAASYFDKALKFDPQNPALLERALLSEVAGGDIDSAADYAEDLVKHAPKARLPYIVIGVRAMREGGYAKAHDSFEKVAGNAAAEIASKLGMAYARFAEGNLDQAKAALTKVTTLGGTQAFGLYHKAVIEDLAGKSAEALIDFEEANRLSEGQSLRIMHAYASELARQGQTEKAKEIYQTYLKTTPGNPFIRNALTSLNAGKATPRVISSAKQGLAETFYGIAASLTDEDAVEIPVFYLQLALALDPHHDLSLSLLADRMETAERWNDAIDIYERVEPTSVLYPNARLQIAQSLQKLKRPNDAISTLTKSLTGTADDVELHAAIGDVLRGEEKYAEAVESYNKAIQLISQPEIRHWTLFYTRGISNERSKRWQAAEADFKQSLKLKPEQPMVMNYLAYSWVEQNINIPEALAMLKRAVDLRPEDGFIVDSLGWAHFRLGDFQTAVKYLEQAVLLEPGQATINDHLGDAYWRLGRKLEAKFQWQHALAMGAEPADEPKIRQKLDAGLQDLPRAPAHAGSPQGGK